MNHTYGMVTLNNGDKFRARLNSETDKVEYMSHRGQKNASVKIAKSFQAGHDTSVQASNRYLFPDEYNNKNASSLTSKQAEWKIH